MCRAVFFLELISDAVDRFQSAVAPVAQLRAQTGDVGIDRADIAHVVVAPDAVEQLLAAVDAARVFQQLFEDVVFLERQLDLLAVEPDLVRFVVEGQVLSPPR